MTSMHFMMHNFTVLIAMIFIRMKNRGKSLSFDEIMEVYNNDEMEDLEGAEFSMETVANGNRDVITEEVTRDEWTARCLATEWGVCDDVVSLKNGMKFYYFKIPHKVSYHLLPFFTAKFPILHSSSLATVSHNFRKHCEF